VYLYFSASFIFFVVFFFTLGNKFPFSAFIQSNWVWDKTASDGMAPDARFKVNPLTHLNGYLQGNSYFSFALRKSHALKPDFSYQIPILGKGFIEYEKVGKIVSYYSADREILWQKDFKSYPKPGFEGDLILLTSGDNNRVFLSDINGNLTGEKVIDGRFLSDYSFAPKNGGAVLLFSGGEIVRLDGKGRRKFSRELGGKGFSFYKSVAISPNGLYSAVHYLNGENDFISMLDDKGEVLFSIKLSSVYPHRIFMSPGTSGNALINLPDSLEVYNENGKPVFRQKKKRKTGIYQLAFHTGEFFIASNEDEIYFLDNNAKILKIQKNISFPARAIPSQTSREFFLETKNEIYEYSLIN